MFQQVIRSLKQTKNKLSTSVNPDLFQEIKNVGVRNLVHCKHVQMHYSKWLVLRKRVLKVLILVQIDLRQMKSQIYIYAKLEIKEEE